MCLLFVTQVIRFKQYKFWMEIFSGTYVAIVNFNHVLENFHTMDDFSFTNFFIDRVMGCSSYCCFHKVVSNNYLINFISTYTNFQFCLLSANRRLWKILSTKRVGHCSFCKAAWNSCFEKVFLMNFISTYINLLKPFYFC